MSKPKEPNENPLLAEDSYSGKIYWINSPHGHEIDLQKLKSELEGKQFQKDISDTIDTESTFVPEIFYKDERIVTSSDISNTRLIKTDYGNILHGHVTVDSPNRRKYRSEEVLMLDTTEAQFLVFHHGEKTYFVVIARREVCNAVISMIRENYRALGSTLNETNVDGRALNEIQIEIDARIRDTIIGQLPDEDLESVQLRGDHLQDTDVFEEQSSKGQLEGYMLQTEELNPEDRLTVEISPDALVRIYSTASIMTYLRLIYEYILPRISYKYEYSPNLDSYEEENDIYRKMEEES